MATVNAILLAYAQIVFSRSRVTGGLLLLSTALAPRVCLFGLVAACAATATAWLFSLEPEARREGTYGYNALLLGLGVGQATTGFSGLLPLLVVLAPACALLTAALRMRSLSAKIPVPILAWPFLLLYPLALSWAQLTPKAMPLAALAAPAADVGAPELFLKSLGALFCLPRMDVGLLICTTLLLHSRIALLLCVGAYAVIYPICTYLGCTQGLIMSVTYNGVLTAMALGGVFYVPSTSSVALGLFGALLSTFVSLSVLLPLSKLGLPLLIVPFSVTLGMLLFAMQKRTFDEFPKSVDFLPGTPEENVTFFRTRRTRFLRRYPLRLRLPFRGTWLCTQGVDGKYTHKDRWRYAYDFEVRGGDGLLFQGQGDKPEDFHAYKLPVLACAPGVVVKVLNDVADNDVGDANLERNWGNLVLLRHAPGLYSMVAHLAKGSVRVYEGALVSAGDLLGLCGNSGRSPQPHIHFQLQASEELGAPTLPCQFNDIVQVDKDETRVVTAKSPALGEEVRNLDAVLELAPIWFYPGDVKRYEVTHGDQVHVESIHSEVDLLGQRILRSIELGSLLYLDLSEDFYTIYDVVGAKSSVLQLFRAALPRVPLEVRHGMRFRDHLPARPFRSLWMRTLFDFAAPFLSKDSIEMEFVMKFIDGQVIIEGEAVGRRGFLQTRAVLTRAIVTELEVTLRGRSSKARLQVAKTS